MIQFMNDSSTNNNYKSLLLNVRCNYTNFFQIVKFVLFWINTKISSRVVGDTSNSKNFINLIISSTTSYLQYIILLIF